MMYLHIVHDVSIYIGMNVYTQTCMNLYTQTWCIYIYRHNFSTHRHDVSTQTDMFLHTQRHACIYTHRHDVSTHQDKHDIPGMYVFIHTGMMYLYTDMHEPTQRYACIYTHRYDVSTHTDMMYLHLHTQTWCINMRRHDVFTHRDIMYLHTLCMRRS